MSDWPINLARPAVFLALLACLTHARAQVIDVQVLDRSGDPVPDVAVFLAHEEFKSQPEPARPLAVMDQVDTRFAPHLLIVQKGESVLFPNSDTVAHHVYSFSRPNNFVLPLYKGDPHQPVRFAYDGVVTIGCNIHDGMLAYILVVDSRFFATTDKNGKASFALNDAPPQFAVQIWSQRIRDDAAEQVQVVSAAPADIQFRLRKKLRPLHADVSSAIEWSDY